MKLTKKRNPWEKLEGKVMQIQWSKLLLKTAVWFCAEIALTYVGLDDLADYSEFVFQDRQALPLKR